MVSSFFSNCQNVKIYNGSFNTNYYPHRTPPAAPEGDSFQSAGQQARKARQQASKVRQQAREVQLQAQKAQQRAHGLLDDSDYDSDEYVTASESEGAGDSDDELELGFQQHIYVNGMRVEQRMGRVREPQERAAQEDAESLCKTGKGKQMEGQDARQRGVGQAGRKASKMGAALERAGKEMERRASEMGTALEKAGEEMESCASDAGSNYTRTWPFVGIFSFDLLRTPAGTKSSKANPIPKSLPPPKHLYTEKHESAVLLIQQKFRIHRSLRTVDNISLEFLNLKSAFEYPGVIAFQMPGLEGHMNVRATRVPLDASLEADEPQPKLAHTAANYPIHSYVEGMEKLLMNLDKIESWGDKGVRVKRASLVKEIEKESAKLERYWKQAWMDYVEEQRGGARKDEVERPKVAGDDEWLEV